MNRCKVIVALTIIEYHDGHFLYTWLFKIQRWDQGQMRESTSPACVIGPTKNAYDNTDKVNTKTMSINSPKLLLQLKNWKIIEFLKRFKWSKWK